MYTADDDVYESMQPLADADQVGDYEVQMTPYSSHIIGSNVCTMV